jgi:hypothetical protein
MILPGDEELRPSNRELIDAGPARVPETNLDYAPFPDIIRIIGQSSSKLPNFHRFKASFDSDNSW